MSSQTLINCIWHHPPQFYWPHLTKQFIRRHTLKSLLKAQNRTPERFSMSLVFLTLLLNLPVSRLPYYSRSSKEKTFCVNCHPECVLSLISICRVKFARAADVNVFFSESIRSLNIHNEAGIGNQRRRSSKYNWHRGWETEKDRVQVQVQEREEAWYNLITVDWKAQNKRNNWKYIMNYKWLLPVFIKKFMMHLTCEQATQALTNMTQH